ncbi:hypothetical protein LINGRAHAP2_LOCUS15290 [Linum grandiflorum]
MGGPRWLTDNNNAIVYNSTIPMQVEQSVNPRCPTVCFSDEELHFFHKSWSQALVVKVLERSFVFPTIKRYLEPLWTKHMAKFRLSTLQTPSSSSVSPTRMITKWLHFVVMVAHWTPVFDETAPICMILTWVCLPKLLIHYFNTVVGSVTILVVPSG